MIPIESPANEGTYAHRRYGLIFIGENLTTDRAFVGSLLSLSPLTNVSGQD